MVIGLVYSTGRIFVRAFLHERQEPLIYVVCGDHEDAFFTEVVITLYLGAECVLCKICVVVYNVLNTPSQCVLLSK